MMVPSCPMAHLIIGQTGFTLAAPETRFKTMFRFGHPGKATPGQRVRRRHQDTRVCTVARTPFRTEAERPLRGLGSVFRA